MHNGEVLLVEDNEEIKACLVDALSAEGYRVTTASNGKEGLEALGGGGTISLVLLDLTMPVMNGYEFLGKMRGQEGFREIPVIVVSANADKRRIEGANGVIDKPFDLEHLFESIRRLDQKGRLSTASRL